MANPTTNYGWQMPTATDLVTDLPADFAVFGQANDTTIKNLNPQTTTGALAYRSATSNVNTALPIGSTSQVLTVVGGVPAWATLTSSAINKNYLINGGFAIAQRGTSFAAGNNNDDAYTLDRWYILSDGNDVIDVTQETSLLPTNGQFAIALDVETVNKKFGIATIIENKDCIGLIGNTVTFSFKAKVSSTTQLDNVKCAIVAWSGTADTVTSDIISAWGAEGTNPTLIANATYENSPANLSLTTSYASYSVSAAVDTASTTNLILFIWSDVTTTTLGDFLFIAESKLELGSSASAFQYAGGTIQGELAACERYFAIIATGDTQPVCMTVYPSAAVILGNFRFSTMRIAPSMSAASGTNYYAANGTVAPDYINSLTLNQASPTGVYWYNSADASSTAGQGAAMNTSNASARITLSAEL